MVKRTFRCRDLSKTIPLDFRHLVWASVSYESLLVAGGIAGNFAGFSAAAILSIVEVPTAAVTLPPWCFSSNEVCVHLEFLVMHFSS